MRLLPSRRHRLTLLVITLMLALYLLLVLDTAQIHSRAMFALWNIAHVPLFFLLTVVFDQALSGRHPPALRVWLTLLLPPLLIFAVATEWLQSLTARNPSGRDIAMNVLGIALAVLWLYTRHYLQRAAPRLVLRSIVVLAIAILFIRPMQMLAADWHRQKAFPVLSDFEHWTDTLNWSAGTRSAEQARDGKHALKVVLPEQPLAGASLRYFPRQWHEHACLSLSVYNPQAKALPLSLRVHDNRHRQMGEAYHDRYNQNFNAKPGWNDLQVPLEKIAHAAQTRIISLDEISTVRVFYQGTPTAGTTFYIDAVRLSKETESCQTSR